MSSLPSTALTPLHHAVKGKGKKRRRNFRPTSRKGKTSQALNPSSRPSNAKTPQESEQAIDNPLIPEERSEVTDQTEKNEEGVENPTTLVKRQKKRKTTGVAIGRSRHHGKGFSVGTSRSGKGRSAQQQQPSQPPPAKENAKGSVEASSSGAARPSSNNVAVEPASASAPTIDDVDAAIFEQDTGDAPRLNKFCSRFKTKRRPKKNDEEQTTTNTPQQEQQDPKERPRSKPREDEVEEQPAAGPIVQIVDGEIVLQESSMVVNGTTTKPDDEFPVVEEEAQLAVVGASYNSFAKRTKAARWTVEETEKFYAALRQVGCDFGVMEVYFDNKRTRKQLKRKFRVESTKNPKLVEKALDPRSRQEIDMSVFQLTTAETEKLVEEIIEKEKEDREKEEELDKRNENNSQAFTGEAEYEDAVVEEDAALEHAADSQSPFETSRDPWPTEEEQLQMETEVADTSKNIDDPLFDEGQEQDDSAVASMIALVPGVVKKTKKKPKFRSMRKKKKKK